MSVPPPPRQGTIRPAGIGASYALNPTPQGRQSGYIPVQAAGKTEVITHAPTLGQFWRSDIRRTTGGRRPRWAGLTAFWLGLASMAFLFIGGGIGVALVQAVALPLSVVAGLFALIAIIAGVGRALGWFGLIFALIGNFFVITWLASVFG
jgi:F0F1-type ATP synthase membrane subunit c/vacuolar-type H+-ATPase subunit K